MNVAEPVIDLSGKQARADTGFRWAALAAGALVLVILALILVSTLKESWPIFRDHGKDFLTGTRWAPSQGFYGSVPFVYGTLLTALIAVIFAVPVSIGIALFITQVAPRWLRTPVVYVLDLLAVVPSVVFGLWGIIVFAPAIRGVYDSISSATASIPLLNKLTAPPVSGAAFFTAGLILAVMITPIITSISREVIDTTPPGEKEAAFALGATRWEMITGSVLPHSRSGIVGAVMLGLGRAMGETIAAALVIGSSPQITSRIFSQGYSMPSVVANEFGEATGATRAALIGLGLLLFIMTIIVNVIANSITTRADRKARGA